MDEELRSNLKAVVAQADAWRQALNRIVDSGASPGPDRGILVQHLLGLQVSSGPGVAYLAMLHALWMDQEQEVVSALNSWNLASRAHTGTLDAEAMFTLGLGNDQCFRARASRMRDLRSRYLKQTLIKATQPCERREYFRIERALAGYLGEASVFSSFPTQRPKVIYVPGLGTAGFLDPQSHPIVPALRSAFRDVQAEFDEVVSDQQALEPFLGHAGGGALEGYVSGGEKASWDALFFFRHGRRFEASHRRCPRTSALLDSLDLCRINGQSPEICFSVLQPGSRIEPHFGVTNARVVVHLPLRVPAECHLALTEVGRHDWVEGEPMVFDDTFEHSALNPSGQPRGILLMDAWHPSLSMVEREAFSGLIAAISSIERDRFLPVEQENA
jgi:hypothetical protein